MRQESARARRYAAAPRQHQRCQKRRVASLTWFRTTCASRGCPACTEHAIKAAGSPPVRAAAWCPAEQQHGGAVPRTRARGSAAWRVTHGSHMPRKEREEATRGPLNLACRHDHHAKLFPRLQTQQWQRWRGAAEAGLVLHLFEGHDQGLQDLRGRVGLRRGHGRFLRQAGREHPCHREQAFPLCGQTSPACGHTCTRTSACLQHPRRAC